MATRKREATTSTSVKEKKGTSPSNSKPSPRKPSSSSAASSSTEKQVPNYLKPTRSSRTDVATKTLKKPATEDTNVIRRRSFDKPTSAAGANKELVSLVRPKTATATTSHSRSLTSKPAAAPPKAPLERVAKKTNVPGKPQTPTVSSSRSSHKSPTITATGTKTRRGSSTPSASRKPPSSPDRKEAFSVETKQGNKENMDRQVEPEPEIKEVVKDDQGEETPKSDQVDHSETDETQTPTVDHDETDDIITPKGDQGETDDAITSKADEGEVDYTNLPKAEESGNIEAEAEAEAVAADKDTTQLKSVVDKGGQDATVVSSTISEQQYEPDISSAVSEQQNEPDNESVEPEPKNVDDQVEEVNSDHMSQHDDGDKENQIQKEIVIGDDPRQERSPCKDQKATTETNHGGEEHVTEEVSATKEIDDEKEEEEPESRQEEDNKGSQQQGLESSIEETVQELDAEKKTKTEVKVEKETIVKADIEAKTEIKAETEVNAEAEAETETKTGPKTIGKSQVQGKKGPATPYNNVIEQTASKLVRERRNKVRALVGAFETVIDQETSNAK